MRVFAAGGWLVLWVASGVCGVAQDGKTYRNPVLFADYSDPDVIRDGSNYYLVSSTFAFVPGISILQSNDLVHWTILSHVLRSTT
jgi:beta-xylosidase